jgi:hypothetical protein
VSSRRFQQSEESEWETPDNLLEDDLMKKKIRARRRKQEEGMKISSEQSLRKAF